MADFPSARYHKPVLSVLSLESIGATVRADGQTATPTSGAWPAAARAIFVPIVIAAPYLVKTLFWANGSAVAGNVDCGVYTADGALLASIGATAQAGTSTIQSASLGTPLLVLPGSYYMALALSSASGTTLRQGLATVFMQMAGCAQMASAEPLPSAATFATVASAYFPLFGIASASVI